MKKKVMFEKTVDFTSMIGEITAISLDKDLKFENESLINGNLILKGKYKLTEASRIEEDFEYNIPIEINLIEKVDITTANIDISDFYYEIKDNESIVCHIELCIDALEIIDDDNDDERECDGENVEVEIPHVSEDINLETDDLSKTIENNEKVIDANDNFSFTADSLSNESENNDDSLFVHLDENSETYGTFVVYIVRQNETINSIIEKYNTSVEELEKYNNLKEISIGTKLIIPLIND